MRDAPLPVHDYPQELPPEGTCSMGVSMGISGFYVVVSWGPGYSEGRRVTVDRTFALNSAFEEIRAGLWWISPDVWAVDNGDFYAQMKAPTRVRDMADGTVRYRWVETGPLDHCRHAQAFDHIAAEIARRNPSFASCLDFIDDPRESGLRANYDIFPCPANYDWFRRHVMY